MVRLEIREFKSGKQIELDELTPEGRQQISYECDRLKEEIEELDRAEGDE